MKLNLEKSLKVVEKKLRVKSAKFMTDPGSDTNGQGGPCTWPPHCCNAF